MTQRRFVARGTSSVHYYTICPTGSQLFLKHSDMSRQRLLVHRRSAATGMSMHYDTIFPAAGNYFSSQYDLSY